MSGLCSNLESSQTCQNASKPGWIGIWMRSPHHTGWWISQVCFIPSLPCRVFFLVIHLSKNMDWKACRVCVLPADWELDLRLRLDFFWQELLVESSVFLSQVALRPAGSGVRAAADGQWRIANGLVVANWWALPLLWLLHLFLCYYGEKLSFLYYLTPWWYGL